MAATVTVSLRKINNRGLGGLVAAVLEDVPEQAGEDMGSLATEQVSSFAVPADAGSPSRYYWQIAVYGGAVRYAFAASSPTLAGNAGELMLEGMYYFSATAGMKFFAIDVT